MGVVAGSIRCHIKRQGGNKEGLTFALTLKHGYNFGRQRRKQSPLAREERNGNE